MSQACTSYSPLLCLELGPRFASELEKDKYTFDRQKEGEREQWAARAVRMKSI